MNKQLKGLLLVLFATMQWGLVGILVQYLITTRHFTPEWLVNTRLLASGIILLIISRLFFTKDIFSVLRKNFIGILILGIIGLLGSQYGFYVAINHSNAPTATILVFLTPVFVALYTLIVKHKAPSGLQALAIILATTGTLLIVTKGDFSQIVLEPMALVGGIGSALCCVLYTLQPRRLLSTYEPTAVIGWSMLYGGLFISLFDDPFNVPQTVDISAFICIASMIIFGTVIAFYFYLKSLSYISPTEVSILTVGEPLTSIVLSAIVFNLSFSIIELIGTACILSTVFILAKAK